MRRQAQRAARSLPEEAEWAAHFAHLRLTHIDAASGQGCPQANPITPATGIVNAFGARLHPEVINPAHVLGSLPVSSLTA
jgi:hypothetical protein